MITLDINSNYCDRGGGIRTYHQAKIAWFARQRGHRYYLVVPGPRHAVKRAGRRAIRIEVFGLPIGGGYRLLLDYPRVGRLLRRVEPDLVEVGDPVISGLFCLALRRLGRLQSWLTAFYHSDLIETWIVPWAKRGRFRAGRRAVADALGRLFYHVQRAYDVTIVTSNTMHDHLTRQGVERVERVPLGVDCLFIAGAGETTASASAKPAGGKVEAAASPSPAPKHVTPKRLLFVGRLISEKAADLLWAALPEILRLPGVEVSILGGGPDQQRFSSARWPGYHYLGYVSNRRQLAEIYRQHDILLAPGPYETFGLAVLEAMACGLVVVGPDRGGTAELLREASSPFVFHSGDVADFVRTITAAVGADLVPYRRQARDVARRYGSSEAAIGRLMAFYEGQFSNRLSLPGPWSPTVRTPAAKSAPQQKPGADHRGVA